MVRDTNLAGVCHQGKLSMLEVLHQQSNVRGTRAKCAHQDQHRVRGNDIVLQLFDVIQSVPGAGCVRRYQPGVIDQDVAPQLGLVIVFENDRLTIVFCFVKRSFLKTIVSFSQKNDSF